MGIAKVGASTALALVLAAAASAAPTHISGDYVEARSASVFAGGCHFGSEYTTDGRQAVLVWHVRNGTLRGVPLQGLNAIAVVSGTGNLAESQSPRESVIYVDAKATGGQAKVLAGTLMDRLHGTLGKVVAVKQVPIRFARTKTGYSVDAPGIASLDVAPMPNNECCKQPSLVWYKPFVSLQGRRVGYTARNSYQDSTLKMTWTRGNENSAFYGTFSL